MAAADELAADAGVGFRSLREVPVDPRSFVGVLRRNIMFRL